MANFSHEFAVPLGGDDAPATLLLSIGQTTAAGVRALYGTDVNVRFDLDPRLSLVSGGENLANAVLRRLSCPAGFHADAFEGDPGYGDDLIADLLNDSADPRSAPAIAGTIERQVERDPRVSSVVAEVELDAGASSLSPSIRIALNDGPFDLVQPVANITAEMLRPKGGG